jgi:hypothetical protein
LFGTEIARGLDVFSMTESDFLSQNEIAAASFQNPNAVENVQTQRRVEWPAEPVVAKAYLDQLLRSERIDAMAAESLTEALDSAENAIGGELSDADLASQLRTLAESLPNAVSGEDAASERRVTSLSASLNRIADRIAP